MSTTVKPLDIYIGDTKVFPDVDLDLLEYSNTLLFSTIIQETNNINENKYCYLESEQVPYMITDNDDTAWHQHNNGDIHDINNYWMFNGSTYDVNASLDLAWLANSIFRYPFMYVKTKVLNFKGTLSPTQGYDTNDWSQATLKFSHFYCRQMFCDAHELEEIHGLNFNQNPTLVFDENYFNQNDSLESLVETHYGTFTDTYFYMFTNCNNLRVLDVEWPSVFYCEDFSWMFTGCSLVPENQLPTIDMHPLYTNGTIYIDYIFCGCNITSTHISTNSWQYIKSASCAWTDTNIHLIDIPATATNLINVAGIIGDAYWPEDEDYSNWKYIIRTTSIMTAHLNNVDGHDPRLFNFWDYDGSSDFMNTFGGIYVPDAQLQDWKDMIANEYNAPNVAANCVFGLSDL